ncbi:MAG: alpha/beta hydrolase [SAR324 cluster bacterium]|nr:alpha/beta hydrolase [SAR324 cluster bacterium]
MAEWVINHKKAFCATGGRPGDAEQRSIIFIHGAGMDHICWNLQSRWFAWHGWSVLVPDLPGHGRSEGRALLSIEQMCSWIGKLMDAAGIKTTTLVGHSMGSAVVLHVAADMADRVDGIALLGAADVMPVHPGLLEMAQRNDPQAYELVTSWAHGQQAHFGHNQQPGIWILGNARQLMRRNRPGVLFSDLNACNTWTKGAKVIGKVKCPAVIIVGECDQMTTPKRAQKVVDMLPNGRRFILQDCGHMMMQEQPGQTLDALISAFVKAV